MKNERILAHAMSQRIDDEELKNISASGTSVVTGGGTYSSQGGRDTNVDAQVDL